MNVTIKTDLIIVNEQIRPLTSRYYCEEQSECTKFKT